MADSPPLKLVRSIAPAPRRAPKKWPRARRIIAVGGGKGGIGKSMISANLGIALAGRGKRVVMVDADLGGANLHTTLGIDVPKRTLTDFIERRVTDIDEVVTPTGIENLGLISGALDHLDADNAILDLGAGTHINVLDFFLVSDHGVLVLVPEPTAVENAYRFVKAAFWRRMRNVAQVFGYDALIQAVMASGTYKSPVDLIASVAERDSDAAANLTRQLSSFRPRLVVNQTRTPQEGEIGRAVVAAWRKYFGLEMDYLGHIPHDGEMWRTVRARRPLLLERPEAEASRCFGAIVDGLVALDGTISRSGEVA